MIGSSSVSTLAPEQASPSTRTESTASASGSTGSWRSASDVINSDWDQLPAADETRAPQKISDKFDWHSDAKCAIDPEITEETFFGSQRQERSMSPKMVNRAKVVCSDCPVFAKCLRSALEYEEQYGVWAGTSGRIRRRIQRMLSEKIVTIDEVVEDYCNGRTARYDGRSE